MQDVTPNIYNYLVDNWTNLATDDHIASHFQQPQNILTTIMIAHAQ